MDMCSPVNAVHDSFVSNLESTFSGSLRIEDVQKSEHASTGNDNCNVGEGNLCGGFEQQETKLIVKCSKKCSTFPYPDMSLPPSSSDEEYDTSLTESLSEQYPHQRNSCLVSLPVEGNLCRGFEWQETNINKKCSKKCSTFPYPDMMLPPGSSDEEDDTPLTESLSEQYPLQSNSCSVSLPLEEGNLCGGFEQQETKLNMKCSKKCSTFPYPDTMLPRSSSDEEDDTSLTESLPEQSSYQSNSCSVSLPLTPQAPPKLISAMKGTREKQGESQMKLTVKWAPDVYDPAPTVLSHIVIKGKKQQKSRNKSEKKNGKKGQKGYSSKGGSGKDKKQYRKLGGTSDLCYSWLDSHDKVIQDSTELDDLDVSHDSYRGTTFYKQSVAKVRYPVGEAL